MTMAVDERNKVKSEFFEERLRMQETIAKLEVGDGGETIAQVPYATEPIR